MDRQVMDDLHLKHIVHHQHFPLVGKIAHQLQAKGHQVYLAGGCVRDALLGISPKDLDIATSATPEQIEVLFPHTVAVGKSFGVIRVIEEGLSFEVATFRQDGQYQDGRHPVGVTYSSPEEDARRRDFTINALFFDLQSQEVIDFVDGLSDLNKRLIKAVGDPGLRFEEDQLRMLRAIRFSSQLGFEIDEKTWTAICQLRSKIASVSRERITDEFSKLLVGKDLKKGVSNLVQSSLLSSLFPSVHWDSQSFPFHIPVQNEEEAWGLFFIWSLGCGASENLVGEFKFSRSRQEGIKRCLSWFVDREKFKNVRMGNLIEDSYDTMTNFGLNTLIQLNEESANEKWKRFLQLKSVQSHVKPQPLIVPADLMPNYQGERLGRALKLVYWAQLEGEFQDKSQGLKYLQNLKLD